MTPNLANLTQFIAMLTDYPLKSAQVVMREGREHQVDGKPAPLLSTGGRGRNVSRATSRDAANLLIAMMVCPWPSKATQYMVDFGDLTHSAADLTDDFMKHGYTRLASDALNLSGNLRDSAARMIEAFGNPEFAKMIARKGRRDLQGNPQPPAVALTIWDTIMKSSIRVDAVEHSFVHESIANIKGGDNLDDIQERYAEENEVSSKYYRRVFSMKTVGNEVILPIAAFISGRDFRQMMTDAENA